MTHDSRPHAGPESSRIILHSTTYHLKKYWDSSRHHWKCHPRKSFITLKKNIMMVWSTNGSFRIHGVFCTFQNFWSEYWMRQFLNFDTKFVCEDQKPSLKITRFIEISDLIKLNKIWLPYWIPYFVFLNFNHNFFEMFGQNKKF